LPYLVFLLKYFKARAFSLGEILGRVKDGDTVLISDVNCLIEGNLVTGLADVLLMLTCGVIGVAREKLVTGGDNAMPTWCDLILADDDDGGEGDNDLLLNEEANGGEGGAVLDLLLDSMSSSVSKNLLRLNVESWDDDDI
jgi:hypothetical protein